MEIQIPLVLFTSFLAWSVGVFGAQCELALRKEAPSVQLPALITSVVLMAIGGIAVFFHLQHPLNLFNGFGHITSGITQELIGIVVMVIVMIIYFAFLRRRDNDVPKWLAILGLVVCLVMGIAMGHSYMMAARPAWDSVVQVISLFGAMFVLGPATVAVIAGIQKVEAPSLGLSNLVGAACNLVTTGAFLAFMQASTGSLQAFTYYFDPTHPNYGITSTSDVSLFSADAMTATVITIATAVVALIVAILARKGDKNWTVYGGIIAACGIACAIALRIVMYVMGATLFMLY